MMHTHTDDLTVVVTDGVLCAVHQAIDPQGTGGYVAVRNFTTGAFEECDLPCPIGSVSARALLALADTLVGGQVMKATAIDVIITPYDGFWYTLDFGSDRYEEATEALAQILDLDTDADGNWWNVETSETGEIEGRGCKISNWSIFVDANHVEDLLWKLNAKGISTNFTRMQWRAR